MSCLARAALAVLHVLYASLAAIASWKTRLSRPPSLTDARTKTPGHVALLFAAEDYDVGQTDMVRECFLESLQRATVWCRTAGIKKLTAYDRRGLLSSNAEQISQHLGAHGTGSAEGDFSDIEYPLTPPSSDSGSRPLSPANLDAIDMNVITLEFPAVRKSPSKNLARLSGVKRRRKQPKGAVEPFQPLTVHLISRLSAKPSIARVATTLLCDAKNREELQSGRKEFSIEVNQMNSIIEGDRGFALPDLTIVHNVYPTTYGTKQPMEFYGFPPWQLRLSEFYHTQNLRINWSWWISKNSSIRPVPLHETEFAKALDQYSVAEMRVGS